MSTSILGIWNAWWSSKRRDRFLRVPYLWLTKKWWSRFVCAQFLQLFFGAVVFWFFELWDSSPLFTTIWENTCLLFFSEHGTSKTKFSMTFFVVIKLYNSSVAPECASGLKLILSNVSKISDCLFLQIWLICVMSTYLSMYQYLHMYIHVFLVVTLSLPSVFCRVGFLSVLFSFVCRQESGQLLINKSSNEAWDETCRFCD